MSKCVVRTSSRDPGNRYEFRTEAKTSEKDFDPIKYPEHVLNIELQVYAKAPGQSSEKLILNAYANACYCKALLAAFKSIAPVVGIMDSYSEILGEVGYQLFEARTRMVISGTIPQKSVLRKTEVSNILVLDSDEFDYQDAMLFRDDFPVAALFDSIRCACEPLTVGAHPVWDVVFFGADKESRDDAKWLKKFRKDELDVFRCSDAMCVDEWCYMATSERQKLHSIRYTAPTGFKPFMPLSEETVLGRNIAPYYPEIKSEIKSTGNNKKKQAKKLDWYDFPGDVFGTLFGYTVLCEKTSDGTPCRLIPRPVVEPREDYKQLLKSLEKHLEKDTVKWLQLLYRDELDAYQAGERMNVPKDCLEGEVFLVHDELLDRLTDYAPEVLPVKEDNILDFVVAERIELEDNYVLLYLEPAEPEYFDEEDRFYTVICEGENSSRLIPTMFRVQPGDMGHGFIFNDDNVEHRHNGVEWFHVRCEEIEPQIPDMPEAHQDIRMVSGTVEPEESKCYTILAYSPATNEITPAAAYFDVREGTWYEANQGRSIGIPFLMNVLYWADIQLPESVKNWYDSRRPSKDN